MIGLLINDTTNDCFQSINDVPRTPDFLTQRSESVVNRNENYVLVKQVLWLIEVAATVRERSSVNVHDDIEQLRYADSCR